MFTKERLDILGLICRRSKRALYYIGSNVGKDHRFVKTVSISRGEAD
jgi:hypothetical protein